MSFPTPQNRRPKYGRVIIPLLCVAVLVVFRLVGGGGRAKPRISEYGNRWTGAIPEFGRFQLQVPSRAGLGAPSLMLWRPEVVAYPDLSSSGGDFQWSLSGKRREQSNAIVNVSSAKDGVAVSWRMEGTSTIHPAAIQPAGNVVRVSYGRGTRISRFGLRIDWKADHPRWANPSPVEQWLDERLTASDVEEGRRFVEENAGGWNLQFQLRTVAFDNLLNWAGPWPNHYEGAVDRLILFHSRTALSLLEERSGYTGGAHGSLALSSLNALELNGRIRVLALSELFRANANWESDLLKLCTERLRALGASQLQAPREPTEGHSGLSLQSLSCFTLSPEGVRFDFAPYEVGSWAEGTYSFAISFDELKAWIDPEKIAPFRWSDAVE